MPNDTTIHDGSDKPEGYATPDGGLEVRAREYVETEKGQVDRWERHAPDLLALYRACDSECRVLSQALDAAIEDYNVALKQNSHRDDGCSAGAPSGVIPDATEVLRQNPIISLESRLRQLSAKWREDANEYPAATDERATFAAAAVRLCANELDTLLSEVSR